MRWGFLIPALLLATTANAQTINLQQFIQKNSGADNGQKLQQALAMGLMLGCVKKHAGTERTQALYGEIEAIAKEVRGLCKAGKYDAARETVLAKIDQKKGDPMLPIIDGCYQAQAQNLPGLSSPEIAADIAKYDRWVLHPQQARAEMTERDICRKAPQVARAQ